MSQKFCLLCFLLSLQLLARAQGIYPECTSFPGMNLSDIRTNSTGEICLLGVPQPGYSPTTLIRADKFRTEIWRKGFPDAKILDYKLDDGGNVYVLTETYRTVYPAPYEVEYKFQKYT